MRRKRKRKFVDKPLPEGSVSLDALCPPARSRDRGRGPSARSPHPPPQSPLGLPPPPAARSPAGHFRSSSRRRNEQRDAVFPRGIPGRGKPRWGSGQGRDSPGRAEGAPRPPPPLHGPQRGGARAMPASLSPALRGRRSLRGEMATEKSLCPEYSVSSLREQGEGRKRSSDITEKEGDGAGRS